MSNSTVVVVTGVSSGIGRVAAERFAKRGCRVFGTVRSIARTAPVAGVELIEMTRPFNRVSKRSSSARRVSTCS